MFFVTSFTLNFTFKLSKEINVLKKKKEKQNHNEKSTESSIYYENF